MRKTSILLAVMLLLGLTLGVAKANGDPVPYLVKNIIPDNSFPSGDDPYEMLAGNGRLFFLPKMTDNTLAFWTSDGTEAGTVPIPGAELCSQIFNLYQSVPPITAATMVGNTMFFTGADCQIWRTDGTAAGTRQAAAITSPFLLYKPYNLTAFKNKFFFIAGDQVSVQPYTRYLSLWISDGTSTGTEELSALYAAPGSPDLAVTPIRTNNALVFFFTYHTYSEGEVNRYRLWRSDGTPQGTGYVAEFLVPYGYWQPDVTIGPDGMAYFKAPLEDNNVQSFALWRSDGTIQGTWPLEATEPFVVKYNEDLRLQSAGNKFYAFFQSPDQYRLYLVETSPDYNLVEMGQFPIDSDLGYYVPSMVPYADRLFFTHYSDLWETSGTPQSTNLYAQLNPLIQPKYFYPVGGKLFFTGFELATGSELWSIDRYGEPPQLVMDIRPGSDNSEPTNYIFAGGKLYFYAHDGVHGRELWAYDFLTEKIYIPSVRR